MTEDEQIDAAARIIEPELFQLNPQDQNDAYHRFVERTRTKAKEIIALVKKT